MKKTASIISCFILLAACSVSSKQDMPKDKNLTKIADISFAKSLVNQCIDISAVAVKRYDEIEILKASVIEKESVHKCGCMSQSLSYQVFEKIKTDDGEIFNSSLRSYGRFVANKNIAKQINMVLYSNKTSQNNNPIEIHMSCTQPD